MWGIEHARFLAMARRADDRARRENVGIYLCAVFVALMVAAAILFIVWR